ncbi:sensor histidine kinase ybdK [Bacillus cereus VDM053]|nr:sensor histidine kinase ybdK [Bacillus cereus VDM053]
MGELIKSVNLLIERTTYRELELKQHEEIKKELLNKLRHDINTPLTGVKLQLFYLEDQFHD